MGPWRASVLIFIHVVIIAHIVQWYFSGMSDGVRETLSPVEPSESMFTLEGGRVNAGFIMFCAALVSTVIFGRFFCGWACHVVAVQDLCGWMMKKIGVHPKPFRSRLLFWAPLGLALYMFVWPTLRREVIVPLIGHDLNRDGQYSSFVSGLRESDFNRDLNHDGHVAKRGDADDFVPGIPEEVIGLDLNGNGTKTDVLPSATEYPLWIGDIIPLHGFTQRFIVEDFWATFAPWQLAIPFLLICGFATVYFLGAKAFCSYGCPYGGFFTPLDRFSPLRVRVTDDCNQCGHCTAVCTSNVRVHEEVRDYGAVIDPGCMKDLDCVSACPNDALYVGFGPPALKTRPRVDEDALSKSAEKAQRRWDLSIKEEIAVAAVFLVMLLGYRGMYKGVPVLMAMGIAAVASFGAWKLWRLALDRNVRGPFAQLKRDGRFRPAGFLFALVAAAVLLMGLQGLVMNFGLRQGELLYAQINTQNSTVFSPDYKPTPSDMQMAEEACKYFTLAGPISRGGIGFAGTFEQDMRIAWLRSVAGDREAGEAALMRALHGREPNNGTLSGLMQFYRLRQAKPEEMEATLTDLLSRWPDTDLVRAQLAGVYLNTNRADRAIALYDERLKAEPGDIDAVNSAAMIRFRLQKPQEAMAIVQEGLKHRPKSPLLHERLAQAIVFSGQDQTAAIEALKFAAEKQPTAERWGILSQLYRAAGKTTEADAAEAKAKKLSGAPTTPPSDGGDIPSATK